MGASLVYLDKPNKEIVFDEGESDKMKFAAGSMQGWRINMEDSHIASLKFNEELNQQLFGVFDGHGGKEVAQFTEHHYIDLLKKNTNYQ